MNNIDGENDNIKEQNESGLGNKLNGSQVPD